MINDEKIPGNIGKQNERHRSRGVVCRFGRSLAGGLGLIIRDLAKKSFRMWGVNTGCHLSRANRDYRILPISLGTRYNNSR